ncbi:MAG TPA: M90 family metallopeptidase [Arenimonas sp.]|uniref:M90 family metallopeptidase n=1 Tax=Arenimonas sp. TaxID=1872635 RepID=UPI002D7ED0E3|nr:M90 family metallopeptidase [Arenimonas sp.]HEU0152465.1 M90 family metallopeptidase [Arenimonas sp.]
MSLLRRLLPAPPALSADDAAALLADLPFLARLAPARRDRLLALVARFLARKAITPVHGLALSPVQQRRLAALACLPLLEFGEEGLRGWSEVVVYPGAFRVHRRHHDEDTGVVAEWEDELAGEAWDQGPLVLSWDDIEADLAAPEAGFQLVVHEMAHKLDALDGAMDGTPPLPAAWQREWARDFQAAYEAFCARVDAGEDTPIDPYAAEAPEEFFAVTSEYHFSAPALLAAEMPAVASHLRRFYGDSPIPAA